MTQGSEPVATSRWTRPHVRAGNPLGSNVRRQQALWVDTLHVTSVLVTCKASQAMAKRHSDVISSSQGDYRGDKARVKHQCDYSEIDNAGD